MTNIFEQITEKLPKATEDQKRQLAELEGAKLPVDTTVPADKLSVKDVIKRWQTKPTPEDTEFLLTKMKPTISSAMNSYAPGMGKQLGVKAAHLTLQALQSYDPTKGTDPTTFVFHNLKRLNRLAGKRQNIMPLSEVASREGRFLAKVRTDFMDTYDREPSELELADMTGYTLKKINKILNRASVRSDSSMIDEESHESNFTSKDVTDDDYYNYVYASVGPTDQKIMDWASGRGGKVISNMDIAKRLGVTPAAVSQRKAKIQKLMSEVRGLV